MNTISYKVKTYHCIVLDAWESKYMVVARGANNQHTCNEADYEWISQSIWFAGSLGAALEKLALWSSY